MRKKYFYNGVCLSVVVVVLVLSINNVFLQNQKLNIRDTETTLFISKKKKKTLSKIPFYTKSMCGTKQMLRTKIVRFKKICKSTTEYFFIGVIIFLLFFKKVFIKIKNSSFASKYTG